MPQNEGLQVSWRLSLRSNKKNWINKTINKINKLIFKNNISDLQELTSEKIISPMFEIILNTRLLITESWGSPPNSPSCREWI